MSGESASVPQDVVDEWLSETLPKILKGYTPKDVFNADETGLFWHLLPDKTFSFKGDKCHGGKKSKERLSLLLCTNMDGSEKLPLLAIGKFAKPRCFKGVNSLPLDYKANKKAWVVSDLFSEWVRKLDVRVHRQKRKIILFVDNCPAHPMVPGLKSIQLVFLPPNTTSVLQPCDQGIIRSLKTQYKSKVLLKLIESIDKGTEALYNNNVDEIEEESNHGDTVIRQAWDKMQDSVPGVSFEDFMTADDDVSSTGVPTDADIIASITSENNDASFEDEFDDDVDNCGDEIRPPSSEEAQKAASLLRNYFYFKKDVDDHIFHYLSDIDCALARERKVQAKLIDYFSPL